MALFLDVVEDGVIRILILVLTVCHYVEGQDQRSEGIPLSTILAVVIVLIVIVLCAIAIACYYCYHQRQQLQREAGDIKNSQDDERESDPEVHEEVHSNPLYGEMPQTNRKNQEVHFQPSATVLVSKTSSQISEDRRISDDYVEIDPIPSSASETQHTMIQEYHTYLGNKDDTNNDYTEYNTDASTKDAKYKSLQKLETAATNPHERNSQASQTSESRDSEGYEDVSLNKTSESEETSLSTIQEYHTYLGNKDDTINGYTEYNTDASTKDAKYKSLQELETSATNPHERNSQASQTSESRDSESYEDVLNKISESEETSSSTIQDNSTWIKDSHKDSTKPINNNMQANDQLEYGTTEAAVIPETESIQVATGSPQGSPRNKVRVRHTKDVYVNQKIVQQRSPAGLR